MNGQSRPSDHAIDFGEAFAIALRDAILRLEEALCSGRCEDWADYKHMTGELRGLRTAQEQYQEFRKKDLDDV